MRQLPVTNIANMSSIENAAFRLQRVHLRRHKHKQTQAK